VKHSANAAVHKHRIRSWFFMAVDLGSKGEGALACEAGRAASENQYRGRYLSPSGSRDCPLDC
jgi:hypothetical protein